MPTVTLLSPHPSLRLGWLRQAGITARLRPGEPGVPALATCPPPLLLDSVHLHPIALCRLLAALTTHRPRLPTLALVDPADGVARHLLPLCPAVVLLVSEHTDPSLLGLWLAVTAGLEPQETTPTGLCLLDPALEPPRPLPLPADLLALLPALATSTTWHAAAQQAAFSQRHLRRRISRLCELLQLVPPRLHPRAPPPVVAAQVIAALAAVPVAERLQEQVVG